MLLDGLRLAEFRSLSNGVSQGDYQPGLFPVEIVDQSPLDQDHPTACGHGLRMCGALAIAVRVPYNPCPGCAGPDIAHQEELWYTTLARFDSKWGSSQSSA
jgi:hypothetical protein